MKRAVKKTKRLAKRSPKRLLAVIRDHFIPHAGNNHLPHVLRHRALFGYSVILILLKVLVITVGLTFPGYSLFSSAITPSNIIALTNETRRSLNLSELTVDPKLAQAAQAKAEDMFKNQYFAHTSPDGVTPWDWIKSSGYNYRSAGENLAANFTEAEDVEAGWMASPTHHDNIVSDRYDEIGVGIAQGMYDGYQTTFVVQMFGYELGEVEEIAVETAVRPSDDVRDGSATRPYVNQDSLSLIPIDNGYAATIKLANITSATLNLASNHTPLVPSNETDVWQGLILYTPNTLSDAGERLYLTTVTQDGKTQNLDLAWVMPNANTSDVYTFKPHDSPKLLGIMDIVKVDDTVHQIYLATLIFLSVALMLGVFIKIEHQHPVVIAHGLGVIALGVLLSF